MKDPITPTEQPFTLRSILGPMMAIILGMIIVILDGTVVNVAIPKLQEYFATDLKMIQWTITGYILAMSAVIPLAGWMMDRFGAKRIFLITIILFTLGSALCAMAQTVEQLILYRVIQGLGGGMVAPIGMAMIFKLAPPEKRGVVMGFLGVPMLLGPALGPVLSGWLVDSVNWQWIFLINVPIGAVALMVGIRKLPTTERQKPPHLDYIGMILGPIAFASLAYGVTVAAVSWTSVETIASLSIGGGVLILFIIVELMQKQPLLELRVFRSSDFTRGIVLTWVSQIALIGAILLVPLYLQTIMNYSALETGLILIPQALASAIGMPIGGMLFDKIGARPLAFTGLGIITFALYLLSNITMDTGLGTIFTVLILMGLGMGFAMMPLNTHVLNSAPLRFVSRVTALTTALQQVVGSFAVAGLTAYLSRRMTAHLIDVGPSGNPLEAGAAAYADTFFLGMWVGVVGVVISLILRKPKLRREDQATDEEKQSNPSMIMH